VGEVGVELKMRADFNGNGTVDVYMKTAWGYWAMTPELTLGGGYAGSLGNIGYGYDGACTCYYTDNADGGTSIRVIPPRCVCPQRFRSVLHGGRHRRRRREQRLRPGQLRAGLDRSGAAGEIKYSGDAFSARSRRRSRCLDSDYFYDDVSSLWQIGAGVGFNLGDMASISLAAAVGEGPVQLVNDGGDITGGLPL